MALFRTFYVFACCRKGEKCIHCIILSEFPPHPGTAPSPGVGVESLEHRPTLPIISPAGGGGLPHNDSNLSFTSVDSESSLDQLVSPTPPHTPLKGGSVGGLKPTSILKNRQQQQEDLYQWMAKQQDGFKVRHSSTLLSKHSA